MLLFEPFTREHFRSIDAFFEHLCASASVLEERLAMAEDWRHACSQMYLRDALEPIRRGGCNPEILRSRCREAVERFVEVYLAYTTLACRLCELHGVDPETWLQFLGSEAAGEVQ